MKRKDVKAYFKNAKEVKCLADGQVFNISNPSRNIYFYDSNFWLRTREGEDVKITNGDCLAEIISYKDTYTVSKDFVLEAHKDACSTWKTKIENQFPELFPKVDLEVGKWYKAPLLGKAIFCVTKTNNEEYCAYGIDYRGYWTKEEDWTGTYTIEIIPATKEEVETALIAEAKKRGFKEGVKFKSAYDGLIHHLRFNDLFFRIGSNALSDGNFIFYNGKWAEIISEPIELSLDEIAEKFGVDVSLIKIKK